MDLGEGSGRQRSVLVLRIEFNKERTGALVDRARRSGDAGLESATRILRQDELRLHPMVEIGGVALRRLHVDAHLVRIGDHEQAGACVGALVDERADVDVALRDDAVERRDDVGERLERLEAVDIVASGGDFGFALLLVCGLLVRRLLRDGAGLAERLPAPGGNGGKGLVGFSLGQLLARFREALVEFRRIDDGEEIARLHARADVLVPLPHIAAHLARGRPRCNKRRRRPAERVRAARRLASARRSRQSGSRARESIARASPRRRGGKPRPMPRRLPAARTNTNSAKPSFAEPRGFFGGSSVLSSAPSFISAPLALPDLPALGPRRPRVGRERDERPPARRTRWRRSNRSGRR